MNTRPEMKFYLLVTIIILFGYFQYSNSLDTPCSYCKYCDFCDDCKQCPCTDKKNCKYCGYCTYCKYCSWCSWCAEGGFIDKATGIFTAYTAVDGWNWVKSKIGLKEDIDSDAVERDIKEALKLKEVKQKLTKQQKKKKDEL